VAWPQLRGNSTRELVMPAYSIPVTIERKDECKAIDRTAQKAARSMAHPTGYSWQFDKTNHDIEVCNVWPGPDRKTGRVRYIFQAGP